MYLNDITDQSMKSKSMANLPSALVSLATRSAQRAGVLFRPENVAVCSLGTCRMSAAMANRATGTPLIGATRHITGCVVPYNKPSRDLGGFKEIYAPGCFTESIREDDIFSLFNHNENYVLGRTSAGTLEVFEDAEGVQFDIDPPLRGWAGALVESIERGDITGMSAGFLILKSQWKVIAGEKTRVIEKARMVEGSVATFPMYESTRAAINDGKVGSRWAA